MMKLGAFSAEGFAQGVEGGGARVASAGEGLAIQAAKTAAPTAASAGGLTVNVMAGAIQIAGGAGSALELTEEAVTLLFERIALEQGLVAP
jgi:hypothetical protein